MWQLRIEDPSGETRMVAVKGSMTLGRSPGSEIFFRDPTVPPEAGTLWCQATDENALQSPFWIKISSPGTYARLGDLDIRESQLPLGLPLQIGETKITLEIKTEDLPLPEQPKHIAH